MGELTINLLFGLIGALIGAFAGIFSVRFSHILQAEANLRSLLVAQKVALRGLGSSEIPTILRDGYTEIFQAYQNLRALYWFWRRKRLDKAWRRYKGNIEDCVPLFGNQIVTTTPQEIEARNESFSRDEVLRNLDEFLIVVHR
jgi:hypothetical protein